MDDSTKVPIRHNGSVTSILEDLASRRKVPPALEEKSPRPVPHPGSRTPPAIETGRKDRRDTGVPFASNDIDATSTATSGSAGRINRSRPQAPGIVVTIDDRLRCFVGHAGRSWPRLSSGELWHTNGYSHNLCLLVQQRYGMMRQQAELQVREFFELHPM